MLKKLDSLLLYINDVGKSAKFYHSIGFEIKKQTNSLLIAKLGSFEIHYHDQNTVEFKDDAKIKQKGAGVYIYIKVEGIDKYYSSLLAKGLKPSSNPKDWSWGNREFVIRDPDGYKLVFYQKLKQ